MSNLDGLEQLGDGFEMEQAQWDYATIGYNSVDGVFYVGEEQVKELTVIPLALRQCKQVTTPHGTVHRYHIFAKKADMALGESDQRVQMLCWDGEEIRVFGANSWTARALFVNPPETDKYHDQNFQVGLMRQGSAKNPEVYKGVLPEFISRIKAEKNVATRPYCWRVKLSTGKPFKNPMDAKRMITPIVYTTDFEFVGAELANKLKALHESENLADWVNEWAKAGGVAVEDEHVGEAGSIGAVEDDIDSIPGFEL